MWKLLQSKYIYKSRWLTVRKDHVITEKEIEINDFYVLEYPKWVNVIAITEKGKFIIVQQYRHGIRQNVFELCAGVCESSEFPLDAAKRELLEETGFGGGKWTFIGKYAPNPNSMNNWCYSFLAEGVTKNKEPQQEPTENIIVNQLSSDELIHLIISGKMVEGIMLSPLWQYFYNIKRLSRNKSE